MIVHANFTLQPRTKMDWPRTIRAVRLWYSLQSPLNSLRNRAPFQINVWVAKFTVKWLIKVYFFVYYQLLYSTAVRLLNFEADPDYNGLDLYRIWDNLTVRLSLTGTRFNWKVILFSYSIETNVIACHLIELGTYKSHLWD